MFDNPTKLATLVVLILAASAVLLPTASAQSIEAPELSKDNNVSEQKTSVQKVANDVDYNKTSSANEKSSSHASEPTRKRTDKAGFVESPSSDNQHKSAIVGGLWADLNTEHLTLVIDEEDQAAYVYNKTESGAEKVRVGYEPADKRTNQEQSDKASLDNAATSNLQQKSVIAAGLDTAISSQQKIVVDGESNAVYVYNKTETGMEKSKTRLNPLHAKKTIP